MFREFLHLTFAGIASHLGDCLEHVCHSRRAECMAIGGTAAVGVHRLVAVIGNTAVQNIFPTLALRQIADLLGRQEGRRTDKVIDIEKIDIIRGKTGQIEYLTGCLRRRFLLQMRNDGIQNGSTASENFDRFRVKLLCNLSRNHNAGCCAVRHAGIAGCTEILGHLGVAG